MSPSAVCKGVRSSPSPSLWLEKEVKVQGIGSILSFSEEKQRISEKRESLRRTLSADMSSKQWLALKKTASSDELKLASDREQKEETIEPQFNVWSSILSKSDDRDPSAQTLYIHPLVKRSASSLSEKSLQICTESLGSETGSDGFSSSSEVQDGFFSSSLSSPSDVSEVEQAEETEQVKEGMQNAKKGLAAVNYNCSVSRRSPPRLFPPPLPSISRRDGPCLHMRPHRRDGRLVLEAVPVASHNYLHAERGGGRLRLTFINSSIEQSKIHSIVEQSEEEQETDVVEPLAQSKDEIFLYKECKDETFLEEEQEEFLEFEDEDGEAVEEEKFPVDREIVLPDRIITVHRSVVTMNKLMGKSFQNLNPWTHKKLGEQDGPDKMVAHLSPASAPFNTYEYWWRNCPSPPPNKLVLQKKTVLSLQVRRCKDSRKTLLVWPPRCIETT